MANQWLRLWHDMPNDPKWRTIARLSGQPVSLVVAVYVHQLVDASRNVTRGHVTVTHEDLASALDVSEDAISSIVGAMQGRVMDGDYLTGWNQRQVKREDEGNAETGARTASQRKRDQREREKLAEMSRQEIKCHDESRNVTTDKDKDKEESKPSTTDVVDNAKAEKPPRFNPLAHLLALGVDKKTSADWLEVRKAKKAVVTLTAIEGIESEAAKAGVSVSDALAICCRQGWSGFKASWDWGQGAKPGASSLARKPAPENFANRDYGNGGLI